MSALKDISSVEGSAALLGAIRKEQFFTGIFARRAREKREKTGETGFTLNPKTLKPVAAPVGTIDKRKYTAEDELARTRNLVALQDTLKASQKEPQEKTHLPRSAASDVGWHWKDPEAAIISRKPLRKNANPRCEEVRHGENFAAIFLAGPFNKTQPICRTFDPSGPAKKVKS
jgi:hypothetical protein